jgi:hypothetical protein
MAENYDVTKLEFQLEPVNGGELFNSIETTIYYNQKPEYLYLVPDYFEKIFTKKTITEIDQDYDKINKEETNTKNGKTELEIDEWKIIEKRDPIDEAWNSKIQ